MNKKVLILDNIRSAHNVGSIFRTADGAGVEKIYLYGYTPAPVDRFGREQAEIKKTSLGAANFVEWETVSEQYEVTLAEKLKLAGYEIIVVEQVSGAVEIGDWKQSEKVAYVLGNEVDGVSEEWLTLCDQVIEIKMLGEKESLNVSVTAGIVLFH